MTDSALNLTGGDLAMFAKLGINEGLLALAQVRRVSDQEARTDYGIVCDGQAGGIIFPYFRNGHRVTARLRRDFPEMDSKGKPKAKYLSPKNDVRHFYFPPGSDALLEDPSVPLLIVEAEKSSLAIAALAARRSLKVFAIASGGCWSWTGKNGPLSELAFAKDGRVVGIMFDSNTATNQKVRKARAALAKQLRKQGAKVQIFDLPKLPDVNGPDDLVAIRGDQAFIDLLQAAPAARPTILCDPGGAPVAADKAEEILLEHFHEQKIFQRAGLAVRVVTLPDAQTGEGLKRPAGTVLIQALEKNMLLEALERLINFEKINKRGKVEAIDCPGRIADFYLGRTESRNLPVLTGTIFTPFMRADGSIVQDDGYDPQTGLYLISTEDWLPVSDEPTREDALEALATLMQPFAEFPWCHDVDFSVHLAGILSIVQRRLLETAPLFGYSAPMQREGKSMLADALSLLGTGHSAPCQAVSHENEEFRKAIFASLLEGHACVNLDNIERPLASAYLSIALTQPTYSDRILGSSQTVHLSTRTLWTATGCNLSFKGDLAVRTLLAHIDARSERPEERSFKIADFPRYLKENRARLIQAVLTILRAYHLAGRPVQDIKNWGGFDDWSRQIRAPLVWLGLPDPAGTREATISDDPDRDASVTLLAALREAYGAEPFTVAKAVGLSKAPGYAYLEDALKGVAQRKNEIDLRVLGWWLRRWKGRFANGMCLRDTGKTDGVVRWQVEATEGSGV